MSTFNTDDNFIDQYLGTTYSEETCDLIMADIHREFGENADAQVTLDTDTTEIEIIVRDVKKRLMKCSSLKLFKDKHKEEEPEWPTGGYGEGEL